MVSSLEPHPAPPKRRSKAPLIALVVLLLLGGLGAGGYLYVSRQLEKRRVQRFGAIVMPDRIARVPGDWSVQTLAGRLQKNGKVRDASAFEEVAEQVGLRAIKSGVYRLPAKASPLDLARVFRAGPTTARVTFPEGFTGWQIAARLQNEGFGAADELEKLLYPNGKTSPFEGTLFPSTYDLDQTASAKTLLARLQDGFARTLKALPRPFPKVDGKELSTRELVTLASLVEREAASADEMPLVAGVIVNRLNRPMRLQIDASTQYARLLAGQNIKERLLNVDNKIESPYNLYRNDGFPPGPICNPGQAALLAAARPAKTDALYYVLSPKSGKHRFSRSYSEFLKNKQLAARERRGKGKT